MTGRAPRIAAALWAAAIVGGLVVGALAAAGVGPAAAWRDAIAMHGPGCPFLYATGVPCPFCGLTRATLALGAGDWHTALVLHPLAPLVVAGTLVLMLAVALGRSERLLAGRRALWLLAAIAAIWILRLVI